MEADEERAAIRGEAVKFAVLVVVLLLVVLVVALSRPFVFGRVLPVVLGEPAAAPVENVAPGAAEEEGETAVDPAEPAYPAYPAEAETEAENETFLPALGGQPEDAESEGETAVAPDPPDATATPLTHVVQPGETLTRIAQRYDVSVAAIVAANQIADPNRVPAGMALRIPQP